MTLHCNWFTTYFSNILDYITTAEFDFFAYVMGFVPALMALSYPLIVQSVSRLTDVYKSTHILDFFKRESLHIAFKWGIVISVILSSASVFKNPYINLVAYISTFAILGVFIAYIDLVIKYTNPKDLFQLILKKCIHKLNIDDLSLHNYKAKRKEYKEILEKHNPVITDIFCYVITLNDGKLGNDIITEFFTPLSSYSKKISALESGQANFDPSIFNNNIKIIENYLQHTNDNTYKPIEFFSTTFYLGYNHATNDPHILAKASFIGIWRGLVTLAKYRNFDKIHKHCIIIHNYYLSTLGGSFREYDNNFKVTKKSIDKEIKIEQYKKYIQEFNIATCGLIFYKKEYRVLDNIIYHSNSLPARIFFQNLSINDIFNYFITFTSDLFMPNTVTNYYFDDLEFDSVRLIKDARYYISDFIMFLYVLLWVNEYGTNLTNDIQTPSIPNNQNVRKQWMSKIHFMKNKVEKHLNDDDLTRNSPLRLVTRRSCFLSNLKHPIDFLIEIEENLKTSFDEEIKSGTLDPDKIQKLEDYTRLKIKKSFDDLSRIKGNIISNSNRDNISNFMETIRGISYLQNREAFLSEATIHYIDYEKWIGIQIQKNYYSHFIDKLDLLTTHSFKVGFKNIFKALDSLRLFPDKHLIISNGLNLEYLQSTFENNLQKGGAEGPDFLFKGIPIYEYSGGRSRNGRFFVFETMNKPMILHKDWKTIEKKTDGFISYWEKMKCIENEELFIYYEINDLNTQIERREEIIRQGVISEEELENRIEFNFDFLGYCWFPKGIKIVEITQASFFEEGGDIIDPEEIPSFTNIS